MSQAQGWPKCATEHGASAHGGRAGRELAGGKWVGGRAGRRWETRRQMRHPQGGPSLPSGDSSKNGESAAKAGLSSPSQPSCFSYRTAGMRRRGRGAGGFVTLTAGRDPFS